MDPFFRLAPEVVRLTVNVDDEDVSLFENLWPVPDGIALHSYLLRAEKVVVIDPWDAGGYGPEEVGADLEDAGLAWDQVTAVAFTKAPAPDLMARIRALAPQVQDWGIPTAGARYDLGQGVVLGAQDGFWVSSPSGVVFTGDILAGLGWVEDEGWAEDLDESAARYFEDEALRWFASRPLVPEGLPVEGRIAAPAHGCPWKSATDALARARRFARWAEGPALDETIVVWPAGAGFDPGADALVGGLLDAGVGINLFRIPGDDPTALAAAARRASLVVLPPGLDAPFLAGLQKDLFQPDPTTAPADLRRGVADRWKSLE